MINNKRQRCLRLGTNVAYIIYSKTEFLLGSWKNYKSNREDEDNAERWTYTDQLRILIYLRMQLSENLLGLHPECCCENADSGGYTSYIQLGTDETFKL